MKKLKKFTQSKEYTTCNNYEKLHILDEGFASDVEGDMVMSEKMMMDEAGKYGDDVIRYINESLKDHNELIPLVYRFIKAILKK